VIVALIIFIITYVFIGLRQIPRVHIDRPAGALTGAVLMIVTGVLTLDQAFAAVDMHTLLLLLGMMIITVYLRAAGFFELMADKMLARSKTPLRLLIFVTLSSGLLSALFVNDTVCLLYTPIILAATTQLGVKPMPYLLALATSSNVGSVMTVTGNPQNMLIAGSSKIHYLAFLGALFPVAAAGLVVCVAVIWFVYRKEMKGDVFPSRPSMPEYRVRKPLLVKTLLVCAAALVAFSLGYPYSLVAAAGAVLLLLFGGVSTETILDDVDWTLLLFFSGLFIVMRGVEASGLAAAVISRAGDLSSLSQPGRIAGLSAISAVLSNLVSNVPAVMLLKPLAQTLGGDTVIWLTLAMSSTLAGNLTLIGSVANLIVAQQARRTTEIGFMEYFRVGALITIITMAIGITVLSVEARLYYAPAGASVSSSAMQLRP
jgi:Na+/H+ antiporter NhaD/arsenite permease-like protein